MLAGLQDQVDSMFPSIRGLVPSAADLQDGEMRERAGRIVRISGYKSSVFDMHDRKERAAYDSLMQDLTRRVQSGCVRILAHDRQILARKDGSSGWFGYLEWMEFDREGKKDDTTTGKGKKNG